MSQIVQLPLGSEYREAIQSTTFCFKDPDLHGGVPLLDQFDMPRPISGNFASVFNITGSDGRRWAVKCFTRYAEDQERRYGVISSRLGQLDYPWQVSFEFLHTGIRVEGKWHPVLKMEWVQGTSLAQFIEAHLWDPAVLATVAKRFADMAIELASAGIAHGDLQHGNLLIAADGGLKLIDYDGMFVPGLETLGANERGHVNYQSPDRTLSEWGPHLDQFSAWVIYVSLVALTLDPTLWGRLRAEGDECLLFRKADYLDPRNSSALLAFRATGDERLETLASLLERLWSTHLHSLPPLRLEDLPAPATKPTMVDPASVTNVSVGQGLPSWIAAPSPAESITTAPPPSPMHAAWMSGHLPPLPSVRFASSAAAARLTALLIVLALVAVTAVTLLSTLPAAAIAASATIAVAILLLAEALLYRRTPERQARIERRSVLSRRQAELRLAQSNVQKFMEDRRRLNANEERDCDRITRRQEEVRRAEQTALTKISAELAKRSSDISARQQSLHAAESTERVNAMRLLQDQYVQAQLAARRIDSSKIPGIGESLMWNLSQVGIQTAADFTGVSLGQTYSGRYTRQVAHIHLRNGGLVHVDGIGPKKAQALDGWRRSLESTVRASQPTQLSPTQASAISQKYANQRQSLANEEQTARAQAAQRSTSVRHQSQADQAALVRELQSVRQQAAQRRAVLDRQLGVTGKEFSDADWRLAHARRAFDAYKEVRYRSYLKRIITG
jgi:hypothetical protein